VKTCAEQFMYYGDIANCVVNYRQSRRRHKANCENTKDVGSWRIKTLKRSICYFWQNQG